MDYLRFIARNRRFLAFGFLTTFFSGFGQTFFVGVFGEPLRVEFGLGHGGFGTLHSLGTLAGACALWSVGASLLAFPGGGRDRVRVEST